MKKFADMTSEESIEELEQYLKRIIDENKVYGISEVYTELSAKEILPVTLKFCDEKTDPQDYEVLELVDKEKNLIISGESGSGKTTTLKWLNYIFATSYLEGKSENFPLYIELNSYIGEEKFIKKPFDTFVAMKAEGKGISGDTLKTILGGKAIILLDGFDLLLPNDEFYPYLKISNFINDFSNCRYVISSRPGFFESIKSSFKVSELEKLTDEKIETFINRYVPNKELADALRDKIWNNEQLKSILSNPMMLYIAIRVAKERKDKSDDLLPSNRSELYEKFVFTLFNHQEVKGKTPLGDRTQIENALTDLYFNLQSRNEVSCKYSEALKFVKKSSEDPRFRRISPQGVLQDCIKLGLLIKNDNYVSYGIHQSFQEYFAALKLKELFESGFDISETFSHPKWEEVVLFASEIIDSIDEFIDSIISKNELALASKCVKRTNYEIKKKLCALLANKMDSRYMQDKINAIGNLVMIGKTGISVIIESLGDDDQYIRRAAAKALGNIKSETAVQSLIKALGDEDDDVRRAAAEALGNISSETAVQSLIKVLSDEDQFVRRAAAKALGNLKSEIAVQSLIKALDDDNEYVQKAAADALGNICTIKNKKQLEVLLKSVHEFSANTAFNILNEIERKERSKTILFDKQLYLIKKNVGDLGNYPGVEHIRPAEEGLRDSYIGSFVDKLKSIREQTTIVDYGCGEGKFLCAMTTLPENAHKNISYIGVDLLARCRFLSRLAAEKHGLIEKFRVKPEFLKPAAFLKNDILVDYIIFMHVFHEIELVYLPDIIHMFSTRLKDGGKVFILDQKELVEVERSFVLWDEEEDFNTLFRDSGLNHHMRFFETGSGKKLSSIEIEKVENKCFSRADAGRNCLAVYKSKQAKLLERRKMHGLSDKEHSEISIQYANISEQITEYEKNVKSFNKSSNHSLY